MVVLKKVDVVVTPNLCPKGVPEGNFKYDSESYLKVCEFSIIRMRNMGLWEQGNVYRGQV